MNMSTTITFTRILLAWIHDTIPYNGQHTYQKSTSVSQNNNPSYQSLNGEM